MDYDFFAFMARMKYIKRWSLMHSIVEENIMEHTEQVAVITHALCLIGNTYFDSNFNTEKAVLYALYHESGEVITGDLPTPIKYFNEDIRSAYKDLEKTACKKLLKMLPDELIPQYTALVLPDESSKEWKVVKYADRISAYIKCIEELKAGNSEFKKAKISIGKDIKSYNSPEVQFFMEKFLPAYEKTLDELE
jgi:5'-deoxynucleotidase